MAVAMKTRLLLTLSLFVLTTATSAVAAQFKALLITKTGGWHHDSIGAAVPAMQDLAKLHDFELVWPNNMAEVITDKGLASYKVIVFMLTTGDILNDEQQAAIERFVQSGKGFAAIHTGTDTEYEWPWYTKMMGTTFHIHPAVQTATLVVKDRNFPGMDQFATRSLRTEEWYEFSKQIPDTCRVLLTVDESTYDPRANWGAKKGEGMGDFHPISWYHEYDGGRAFQTAMGHLPATYSDPVFLHHVYGGIYWAATGKGFKAE
jgi:type 1 glutamine amidotransferase